MSSQSRMNTTFARGSGCWSQRAPSASRNEHLCTVATPLVTTACIAALLRLSVAGTISSQPARSNRQ